MSIAFEPPLDPDEPLLPLLLLLLLLPHAARATIAPTSMQPIESLPTKRIRLLCVDAVGAT
jgi:hypothetical protein